MFSFKFTKTKNGKRYGIIETNHGRFNTPVFMPCATVGSVKAVSPRELEEIGYKIVLGNAYHLYLRPGEKNIKKLGGLHKFMNWQGPILTDSGGFQIFSLKPRITNRGVEFCSHIDGSRHFFTPEKVIDIQIALGSDIIMPLDVCAPGDASCEEVEKATELTLKWLKWSVKYINKFSLDSSNAPALFGIIQGGIYDDLREKCAQEMIKMNLPGYAIGGLAVGENKKDMKRVVKLMNDVLPKNKPRYLMGVGEPDDLIWAAANGMDMFDCVLPTRLGRHGSVWTKANWSNETNKTNLLNSRFKDDQRPIQYDCHCYACNGREDNIFSRAYIHHLLKEKEILGIRLTTLHNLWFVNNLLRKL